MKNVIEIDGSQNQLEINKQIINMFLQFQNKVGWYNEAT